MNMLFATLYTLMATPIEPGNLPGQNGSNANAAHTQAILAIARSVIGGVALLVITISGFRYITAAGDPAKVAKARNGIIYALVGIVIAVIAESILFFVTSRLKSA